MILSTLKVSDSLLTRIGSRSQSLLLAKVGDISKTLESTRIEDVSSEPAGLRIAKRTPRLSMSKDDANPDPSIVRMAYTSVGFLGSLVRTNWENHSDWSLAFRWSLPLAQVFGSYAFQAQFAFRTFPLCRSLSLNGGSGVAMAKVVPEQSTFMRACALGDISTVRSMLQNGESRPTDVTERNWSPLALAIGSGNINLVQLFLDCGAGVNWTFGINQTSPLQWAISSRQLDIVRLLLKYCASQDHINALGWSPMFFCWPLTRQGEPAMLDFMKLLAEDAYQDFGLLDEDGWTCLHRVAAFGSAEELTQLIDLGADPFGKSLPLGWNALQHACFYGNMSCYNALLPHFGRDVSSMVDERGWTLLHLAAASDSEDLLCDLLKCGMDHTALSMPSVASTMHEDLRGKRCSARDIAALESPEHALRFDRALESYIDDDELFFDAEE